ncbi:DUF3231 family protein [Evansella sp. AB-P1]|uniref:DUF3231 family protein n=1 Tax=Evansella sp. AB-P1 TaxID=3037653 RepID=UPI002420234B|nr:DUF3231 family protein [Evansella sp. AB-P1]MDG5789257.1 DUF3231 family protein [Evansella sp. AB-P1]
MPEMKDIRLTASELAVVWSSYQNNSMSICVLNQFLQHVEDQDIKEILKLALTISEQSLQKSITILKNDGQPLPVGFMGEDVSGNAPRLYSDAFYLYYLKNMAKVGLSVYGVALATSAQGHVRDFLSKAIQDSLDLYNKTADVLLSKGLFIRPPYVSTSNNVDFIDDKSYLGGILNLGNNNRPLNVVEITHIGSNVEANAIGSALLTGFAQVAQSKKVREYCTTGKEIAKKHIRVFSKMLTDDDIPSPMPWDLQVTDSTEYTFSDKLIMFHSALIISSSISNYATASAVSLRSDIIANYVRLSAESAQFGKDGADIMVKNKWIEQPPQIPNHKKLAKED